MGFINNLFKPRRQSQQEGGAPTSDEAKQEKERKWADLEEEYKFVCEGGKVMCKYCSEPIAEIKVTSNTISLQDKPWLTTGDKDGKINFDFKGACLHPSQQKPSSPPPPCKSVIQLDEWTDFSDTNIDNYNAILVKSKIKCLISNEDD